MKTRLTALLTLVLIALLTTSEVKSQGDSLKLRLSVLSLGIDTACFNRAELQKISETFILLEKAENRIEYLEEIKKQDFKQIDLLSRESEILKKDISLFKKTIEILNKDKSNLISNNKKLRLTRNISIGIGTIFAIIAIAK